ncbi:thiol peroxidase [Lacticaseibacillus sp. GG6-2]
MEITRHGNPQQTNAQPPRVGQTFPDFSVTIATDQPFNPAELAGHYNLISVVPDIDTRVCSISTKHFNQSMDQFQGIGFYTISTNTVAQQQSWCAAEGVANMQLLADVDGNFGKALGLFVAENNTDARSVWILAPDGTIAYRQLIIEQTEEPDYASALAFLEAHQPVN